MDGQTLHAWAKRFALELPFTEHCWRFFRPTVRCV